MKHARNFNSFINESTKDTLNKKGADLEIKNSGCGTSVGDSSTLLPNPGESEESFKIRTFSASVKDYQNYFK